MSDMEESERQTVTGNRTQDMDLACAVSALPLCYAKWQKKHQLSRSSICTAYVGGTEMPVTYPAATPLRFLSKKPLNMVSLLMERIFWSTSNAPIVLCPTQIGLKWSKVGIWLIKTSIAPIVGQNQIPLKQVGDYWEFYTHGSLR